MEKGISLVKQFSGKISETNWSLRQRSRKYLWPLNHLQTHHNPSFLKKKVTTNVTDQKLFLKQLAQKP